MQRNYIHIVLSLILFWCYLFSSSVSHARTQNFHYLPKNFVRSDTAYYFRKGRFTWSTTLDLGTFYTQTDRSDPYFSVSTGGIKNLGSNVKLGLEGISYHGLGWKTRIGYERLYYSNIGIEQARKNYIVAETFFTFYPLNKVKKWDPYLLIGPSVIFSSSGKQGMLALGAGIKRFWNINWSWHIEPIVYIETSGVRPSFQAGINYHF